jgi:5-methylthioadenosine/S-adenosylhomocysteine deaminase
MPPLLTRNADYVVTADDRRRIIRDGAVAVTDGRIAAVGKTSEVAPTFAGAGTDVIEGVGKLVLPGLFVSSTRRTAARRTP